MFVTEREMCVDLYDAVGGYEAALHAIPFDLPIIISQCLQSYSLQEVAQVRTSPSLTAASNGVGMTNIFTQLMSF